MSETMTLEAFIQYLTEIMMKHGPKQHVSIDYKTEKGEASEPVVDVAFSERSGVHVLGDGIR